MGGRFAILLSAAGAALANVAMGLLVWAATARGFAPPGGLALAIAVLYSADMYFQSFGAVSIVKVNAHWFHVRERGVLSGLFGILISLGLYFAFDWSAWIVRELPVWWVFFIPAATLAVFFGVELATVRDRPGDAGHAEFDTGDASSGEDGGPQGVLQVFQRMLASRAILLILGIEFCSGFMSNAIMQWGRKFARQTGLRDFVFDNWGMAMCVAGILGGMFAGVISDKVFGSRRGPVGAVLYGGMLAGAVCASFLLGSSAIGWVVAFMSLCVIGVHGMLSGTATMDFGGKHNAGIAVAVVDGAVYLGVATQSFLLGAVLPSGEAAKQVANWQLWPLSLVPLSVVGLALSTQVWNARPGTEQASPSVPPRVASKAG